MNQHHIAQADEFEKDLDFRVRLRLETDRLRPRSEPEIEGSKPQSDALPILGSRLAALKQEKWAKLYADPYAAQAGVTGWTIESVSVHRAIILKSDGSIFVRNAVIPNRIGDSAFLTLVLGLFGGIPLLVGTLPSGWSVRDTVALTVGYLLVLVLFSWCGFVASDMIPPKLTEWRDGMEGLSTKDMANRMAEQIEKALKNMQQAEDELRAEPAPREPEAYERVLAKLGHAPLNDAGTPRWLTSPVSA